MGTSIPLPESVSPTQIGAAAKSMMGRGTPLDLAADAPLTGHGPGATILVLLARLLKYSLYLIFPIIAFGATIETLRGFCGDESDTGFCGVVEGQKAWATAYFVFSFLIAVVALVTSLLLFSWAWAFTRQSVAAMLVPPTLGMSEVANAYTPLAQDAGIFPTGWSCFFQIVFWIVVMGMLSTAAASRDADDEVPASTRNAAFIANFSMASWGVGTTYWYWNRFDGGGGTLGSYGGIIGLLIAIVVAKTVYPEKPPWGKHKGDDGPVED